MRRELAQLLRGLRAIRREKLSRDEMAAQVVSAVREARSLGRFMTFSSAGAAAIDNAPMRLAGGQAVSIPHIGEHALRAAELGE
jgi:hypothetical protein